MMFAISTSNFFIDSIFLFSFSNRIPRLFILVLALLGQPTLILKPYHTSSVFAFSIVAFSALVNNLLLMELSMPCV